MSIAPQAQFSLTLRVEIPSAPGSLGKLTSAIGRAGGSLGAIDLVEVRGQRTLRDLTVSCAGQDHWREVVEAVEGLEDF